LLISATSEPTTKGVRSALNFDGLIYLQQSLEFPGHRASPPAIF